MRLTQRKRHLDESGFTLVELVVAMFVIAVVLLLLAGVQVSAMQSIVNATKRQQATAYANQAMETMRALPWDILSKGNVPGFQVAGGNSDPYFTGNNTGGTVSIDGAVYTVRLALTNPQDLSNPRTPLFDATGSNHTVQTDPSKPGNSYDVRSYIINSLDGSAASVGLLVIVSWPDAKTGQTKDLALRSSAYPGSAGCGDKSVMPYLVACQDRLTFAATSAYVSTSVTGLTEGSADFTPVLPGTNVQEVSMQSSMLVATGDSVQVTNTTGEARRGGTTVRYAPLLPGGAGTSTTKGFTSTSSGASNNYASSTGLPQNSTVAVGASPSTAQSVGSTYVSLAATADDARTGTSRSNMSQACLSSQLFAGEPCTYTDISGSGSMSVSLGTGGSPLYALWRSGSAVSTAGGGRFLANKPGAQFGCQTLDASGCTSGRAEHQEASLRLGHFQTGTWDQGITTLVELANYSDSVRTERGSIQTANPAAMTRTGTIRYWDGTVWKTVALTATSSGTLATTGILTWTSPDGVTVEASGSVSATPAASQLLGETPVANCKADTCAISANAGSVTVSISYLITTPAGEQWELSQQTVLAGSAASASFDRRT